MRAHSSARHSTYIFPPPSNAAHPAYLAQPSSSLPPSHSPTHSRQEHKTQKRISSRPLGDRSDKYEDREQEGSHERWGDQFGLVPEVRGVVGQLLAQVQVEVGCGEWDACTETGSSRLACWSMSMSTSMIISISMSSMSGSLVGHVHVGRVYRRRWWWWWWWWSILVSHASCASCADDHRR